MNLQSRYDLEIEKDRLGDRLLTEVKKLERGMIDASSSPSSS
jgi:hypothetical protein